MDIKKLVSKGNDIIDQSKLIFDNAKSKVQDTNELRKFKRKIDEFESGTKNELDEMSKLAQELRDIASRYNGGVRTAQQVSSYQEDELSDRLTTIENRLRALERTVWDSSNH